MGPMRKAPWIFLFCATAVLAQDDELPPDEVLDLVDRYVERGVESLREGNYEEARLRFKKALRRDPKNATSHLGIATCHRRVGAYDKAEAQLRELLEVRPSDRAGKVALAELDLLRGRHGKVREAAREVLGKGGGEGPDLVGLRARLVLAEAHAARGRRGDARDALDFFKDYYNRRYDVLNQADFDADRLRHRPDVARPLSEEMTLIGAALRLYVELSPLDFDDANVAKILLESAQKLDSANWEAWIEWIRVTRVERARALSSARKARDLVTPRNPELADLYTEVAKSLVTGISPAEARDMAETALKINPKQTDARAILARLMLEDNEYPNATEQIEAGLAVNPRHRDLRALQATLDLLLGNEEEFEAGMKGVLAIDPTYGEAFHLAGLVVATRQRRYDTGVELVRRGLAIDAANADAHASLGIFLANLGRAEEARDALAKSRKLLPFEHPIRENFAEVLRYVLETMTEHRTEHFVFRFDPSEYDVLALFLPELMEQCWDDMVKRYGFTPKAPILVEVFRNADDFSVRTLGLPGIPALGACFGGLITLDSPQALPKGKFLWASTARHEFGHVMSLQLSKGQVPRWFTEGLSVLEEKPLDTGWGMDARFERMLFDEYHTNRLPKIASFDAMFRTGRVAYAYHVGGLMLDFLQGRGGEAGIVKALRLYGEDRPMREVFRKAFDLELDEFDRLFREYVGKRVAKYQRVPVYARMMRTLRKQVLKDKTDGDSLLKLAWAHYQRKEFVDASHRFGQARKLGDVAKQPLALLLEAHLRRQAGRHDDAREFYQAFLAAGGEDYDAHMIMASYHFQAQEEDAFVRSLEKAVAAWPLTVEGANNPYAMLRRHYLAKGRGDEALKILEQHARIASRSIPLRLQLAREYVARGQEKDAIRVLEEALGITVYERPVHAALLRLYRDAGARKKAVRAARCVVALQNEKDGEEEVANMYLDLAETLLEDGRAKEAEAALAEAKKRATAEDLPRIAEIEKKLGQ